MSEINLRTLSDLNRDERKQVFARYDDLRSEVMNDMLDDAHFWNCEEYLPCWESGVDYCIGYDRGAHFYCTEPRDFLAGLRKAQNSFCFLSDDHTDDIERAEYLLDQLSENYALENDDIYDAIEDELESTCDDLAEACHERFMSEYEACFDDANLLDYFLNMWDYDRLPCFEYVRFNDDLHAWDVVA